jgi:7-keto-8-aminopelargonate synthetase-like enzyme
VFEGVEEFLAGGVVEEFGVGALGDGGRGVAKEFGDDFQPKAVVQELGGEGAPEDVGGTWAGRR